MIPLSHNRWPGNYWNDAGAQPVLSLPNRLKNRSCVRSKVYGWLTLWGESQSGCTQFELSRTTKLCHNESPLTSLVGALESKNLAPDLVSLSFSCCFQHLFLACSLCPPPPICLTDCSPPSVPPRPSSPPLPSRSHFSNERVCYTGIQKTSSANYMTSISFWDTNEEE